MKTNYLSHLQRNNSLLDYLEKHDLQTVYTANDPNWKFDIQNDTWQLGTKDTLNIEFIHALDIPMQTKLSLRSIIAYKAESNRFGTVMALVKAIRDVGNGWQDSLSFQAVYHALSYNSKKVLHDVFRGLSKSFLTELLHLKKHFVLIISFLEKQSYPNPNRLKGVFDPNKGIYTDEEMQEIQYKLRLRISEILTQLDKNIAPSSFVFFQFSNVMGLLLLLCIHRRPVQLAMLKWSDVLPVGVSFKDHRHAVHSPAPKEETTFSDIEQVHLRTFKAKNGYGFREYAEHRSHRMEPEFSKLIGIYRYFYKLLLIDSLTKQDIRLSKEEQEELLCRCPLFPYRELFTTQYHTKHALFMSVGHKSDAMHRQPSVLAMALTRASKLLGLSSNRVANFKISNNRSRHTVITNAIEAGLSIVQAAAITGVTPQVIKAYTQLDIKGRLAIDEAMAGHQILSKFTHISLNGLKNMDGFLVKNEFDEVQGILKNNTSCQTCKAKIGKPIGCYGCDNFMPFLDADHESNLAIIEQKISFNEGSNPDKNTLKKLLSARLYCKATISLINEARANDRGINHVD